MLAPSKMPVAEGKKMENILKKEPSARHQSGKKLAVNISTVSDGNKLVIV